MASAALKTTTDKALEYARLYNSTLRNAFVIAVTSLLELLVQQTLFVCPCVEETDLANCNKTNNVTEGCKPTDLSVFYGYMLLVVPAIALFFTGLAVDIRLWKVYTGILWRKKDKAKVTKQKRKQASTRAQKQKQSKRNTLAASIIVSAVCNSLLAPCIWVLISLFKGQYYACANTAIPYLFDKEKVTNCSVIYGMVNVTTNAKKTAEWIQNETQSHIIGWYFLAACTVLAFVAFARSRCIASRSYYEKIMATKYKEDEEKYLNILMKGKKIPKKTEDKSKKEGEGETVAKDTAKEEGDKNENGEASEEACTSEKTTAPEEKDSPKSLSEKIPEYVKQFVAKNPARKHWNDVSAVYANEVEVKIDKDKKEYVMYSLLHKWAWEEEEAKARQQMEEEETFEKGFMDLIDVAENLKKDLNYWLQNIVEPTNKAKFLEELKKNGLLIFNSTTIVVTALLESLVNVVVFKCPCVEDSAIKCETVNGEDEPQCRVPTDNILYGVAYLGVPAVVLFFFGLGVSNPLWKYWTRRLKKGSGFFINVFLQSMIAPIVWVCFGLLLGSYYACASTPKVYDFGYENLNQTCMDVDKLAYKNLYHRNMAFSQAVGWGVIGGFSILSFCSFAFSKCNARLSYYQDRYIRIYKKIEENEFVKSIKTRAEELARENVTTWMSKPRAKNSWDEIANFEDVECADEESPAFSHLHKWIVKNVENMKPASSNKPESSKKDTKKSNKDTNNLVNEVTDKKFEADIPLIPLNRSKEAINESEE